MAEMFDIIDEAGNVIGVAPRSQCHGNPNLIHRSVHVVVKSSDGRILLQKRVNTKDIQPGKWDTAVGGHLDHGEDYETAALREMQEELGISANKSLSHLFDYEIRNNIESENVRVFQMVYDGPFQPQPTELECVAFYTVDELKERLKNGDDPDFTPVLCRELKMLLGLSETEK